VKFIIIAVLVVISALAIDLIYIHSLPDVVVAIGKPVRQDDFLYTVTRVITHHENDNFAYVVTIKVNNRARIVDYHWRDEIAYVTDASGRQYRAAPASSGGQDEPAIPAGRSASYTLTFVLPASARTPMLRYSNGILMGDVFDGAAYRRAAIPL
jgi:hypothetical protein